MNESKKLTQEEAEHLLDMAKKSLVEGITFPEKGHDIEFDVVGSEKKDLFATKIYRGKINPVKYEIGARIKKDGILLLELHVNPSTIHVNPDGKKSSVLIGMYIVKNMAENRHFRRMTFILNIL